jgi:acyl transferase domain-containing protein
MTVILQICLVRLLQSWGVVAEAVTGHSSGEIAAAYTAGALTFDEAITVAFVRGKLTSEAIDTSKINGGITSIATGRDKAERYIRNCTSGVPYLACDNSPENVTVSGERVALDEIESLAKEDGVFTRRLRVPAAYHSPQMHCLEETYREAIGSCLATSYQPAKGPNYVSLVTGKRVHDYDGVRNSLHWARNMVQPVLFQDALASLLIDEHRNSPNTEQPSTTVDLLLEIGPHGALQGILRQNLREFQSDTRDIECHSCLKRGEEAVQTLQQVCCALHLKGYPIDLLKVNFPGGQTENLRVLHDLPHYTWNHSNEYWVSPFATRDLLYRENAGHRLLGHRVLGLSPNMAC